MYSPKISEALIPRIYRVAKAARVPMTKWVNHVIEKALPENNDQDTSEKDCRKERRRYDEVFKD